MKHKLTIEFASLDDLNWAEKLITRAQEKVKADLPYSSTPLSGGTAAILLSALGRSKKLTRK
jgi:hypothetical protein